MYRGITNGSRVKILETDSTRHLGIAGSLGTVRHIKDYPFTSLHRLYDKLLMAGLEPELIELPGSMVVVESGALELWC